MEMRTVSFAYRISANAPTWFYCTLLATAHVQSVHALCYVSLTYAPDMEFLEVLTEGLERVLLVRGGGREVITIYSWPSTNFIRMAIIQNIFHLCTKALFWSVDFLIHKRVKSVVVEYWDSLAYIATMLLHVLINLHYMDLADRVSAHVHLFDIYYWLTGYGWLVPMPSCQGGHFGTVLIAC